MGIRIRQGNWHYRFNVDGHEYSGNTALAATERNRSAAQRAEAKARELVISGKAHELHLEVRPFNDAAVEFLSWAEGEHRESRTTVDRLRTSFASLIVHFGKQPVSSILAGHIERYKSWRRTEHKVREVTLRHDLHALSKAFGYWKRLNWCRTNPVSEVDVPSDRDAVRQHILSDSEETLYFEYAKTHYSDLYDFGRLMLATGMRPWEELIRLRKEHVDLVARELRVVESKSRAGVRMIPLNSEAMAILARRLQSPGALVFPSERKPGRCLTFVKFTAAHNAVLEAIAKCKCGRIQAEHGEGSCACKNFEEQQRISFVLYDLRHTAATRWAEDGMPVAVLAKMLGHADLRTVSRYVHVRPEAQRAAMTQFEKVQTDRYRTQRQAESIN